jgi:hypothetical protein
LTLNSSDVVTTNPENAAVIIQDSQTATSESIAPNCKTEQTQIGIIDSILLCDDSDSGDDEDIEVLSKVLLADIKMKKELIDSEETCHDIKSKGSYQIGEILEDEYMETYSKETPAIDVDLDHVLPKAALDNSRTDF